MDFRSYDWIVINTSAGKDSHAMMDEIVRQVPADLRDRIVAVHCDLGRVEWKGTKELAAEQTAAYGIARFEVVRREQDLLDQIEARGMFPSSSARFCTSDQKRDQVAKLFTTLTEETLATLAQPRQVRILNCMGIRADESPARAKKNPFVANARGSNGKRAIDTWYPIFDWTDAQVWTRIMFSSVRWHDAYELGMERLSCCFCVMAKKSDLLIAGRANPELLAQYVAVEKKIGHTFTKRIPIKLIQDELRGEQMRCAA